MLPLTGKNRDDFGQEWPFWGGSINVTDLKFCEAYFLMFFDIFAKNWVILKKKNFDFFFSKNGSFARVRLM